MVYCGGKLSRFEDVIRYVEDIILPQLIKKATKTVTRHIIERGYCVKCGSWTAAKSLSGQTVRLGRNVKLLVAYLVTILDCSYEQVKTLTNDLYDLTISAAMLPVCFSKIHSSTSDNLSQSFTKESIE